MNRCITCGKIVTRPKAQNKLEHDGHSYLVCCPMCEKEFLQNRDHYIAVAQSIFGDYAVKAHSQGTTNPDNTMESPENQVDLIRMLRNLQGSFEALERANNDLVKHFDEIAASGGLEGLRSSLNEHRQMMNSLKEDMAVHTGVCRFVLSVADSTTKSHAH